MTSFGKPKFLEIYICGLLTCILALIVIFGWISSWPVLIQILPTFVPMQFNTALGFLISGLILLNRYHLPKISVILSILLMIIGVATLIEYIFLINLKIDEIFFEHYIQTYTSHPGRMSPNTALCFSLFGFAYFLAQFQNNWTKICSMSAVFIVGLSGVLSLVAYVFGLKFIFGWGNLTGMAVHTAAGFTLIGLGSIREFAHPYMSEKIVKSILFPIIIFSSGFIIFQLSWQGLISLEDEKIKTDLNKDIHFISEELYLITDSRVDAIDRLFSRVVWLENYNTRMLENNIDDYFSHFENLLLISANYQSANLKLYLQKNISPEIANKLISECYRKVGNASYNNGLIVGLTKKLFCIYEPNRDLLAVYDTDFIERVFQSELFNSYFFILKQGDQIFYSNTDVDNAANFYAKQWSEEASFDLAGDQWDVRIWLNEDQIREIAPDYPVLYLLLGLILTLLLSISVRIWQNSNAKKLLLDELNEKFTSVIENTTTSIFIFNQDARITFANSQAIKLTGYSMDELLALNVTQLIPTTRRAGHSDNVNNYFKHPTRRIMSDRANDIKLLDKNNNEIPVEIGLSPVKIQTKPYVLATVLDVTERKKIEQKIQAYTEALKRSNEELDSFAYIASHDLKEPLRGIHNFSGFLMEDYADQIDEDGVHQLKTLQKLSSRMEELINNLLHFSRVGRTELSFADCNLNKIIQDKLEFLADFISRNNADVIITAELPTIHCDEVRIGEVFQNLITNAIKYNNKDKKIVSIAFEDKPNEVVFSIADNGIGVAEEHYENIFKIFKRLHGRDEFGGGSGAGMTIVKKIIERHGGKIWLDSVLGTGTTFYFSIPKEIEGITNVDR
ncbi:ATP-binding protein [Francisellaceae bacterium]|nr:ATP-binding protein [Francisellaceae bacterium]